MIVTEDLKRLSFDDKISMIEMIWDSLDSEQGDDLLTKEQQEEINRRIEKHEKGEGKTFTWDEIQSRLKFR